MMDNFAIEQPNQDQPSAASSADAMLSEVFAFWADPPAQQREPQNRFTPRQSDQADDFLWTASDPQYVLGMLGIGSLFHWLRDYMRATPEAPRVSADLTPYVGNQRFSVPMNGEVRLAASSDGQVELYARETPYSTNAMLRRTPEGWLVRSVGEGFYYRPEGSQQLQHVPAGTSVRIGPNDEIRLGPEANSPRLSFRTETEAQRAAQVAAERSGVRVECNGSLRRVEIAGRQYEMIHQSGFFYCLSEQGGSTESHVKLHVEIANAADLARVQAVLIPALQNDPELRRLVSSWKTIDPSYAAGNEAGSMGVRPTGGGQGAKGFTIYCATPEQSLAAQRRIATILAEAGLALPQRINTGNIDRVDNLSRRVGIVRDCWAATYDSAGRPGFALERELIRQIHEHFGLADGQRLSVAQRRQLERDLNIAPNRLTYDRNGQLMMRASHIHSYHGGLYATESGARTPAGLTDRPALYALYNRFNADPAEMLAGARNDLTFLRSTALTTSEAQQIRQEINRFGNNRLGDATTAQRFVDSLLVQTRQWNEDLRPIQQRQQQLADQMRVLERSMRTAAYAEAHEQLGSSASAEAVRQRAESLLSGETAARAGGAFALTRQQINELRRDHASASQRLNEVTTARARHLQDALNEFCRANQLPEMRINVVESANGAQGAYQRGSGVINIPRAELLDRAGGVTAVRALYHELVHGQQDQTVVRMLADRANVRSITATDADFRTLNAAYRQATGGELSRDFLNQVLRLRREGRNSPEPLSSEQTARAERLAEGFRNSARAQQDVQDLGNTYRVIESERAALSGAPSNRAAEQLIQRLIAPEGEQLARRLFGSAERARWPEPVRQLVQQWESAQRDARGQVPDFNELAARRILSDQLGARHQDVGNNLSGAYDRYRRSLHEQEAHLFGAEIDRLTQREFVEAIASARGSARSEYLHIAPHEAVALRDVARQANLHLAHTESVNDFVRALSRTMQNWRDDLTAQWERGSQSRTAMQEAQERVLSIAREHLRSQGVNVAELERQARQMLDTPSRQLLDHREFAEARNQFLSQRDQYFREFAAVHEVIASRQQQLQAELDRMTSRNGVPRIRLQLSESGSASGGYDRGAGTLTINPADLVSRANGQQLIATIGRQFVIAEQDALVVRGLVDRVNGARERAPNMIAPGEYTVRLGAGEPLRIIVRGESVSSHMVESVVAAAASRGSRPRAIEFVHDRSSGDAGQYDSTRDVVVINTANGSNGPRDQVYLHEWGHHLDYSRLTDATQRANFERAYRVGLDAAAEQIRSRLQERGQFQGEQQVRNVIEHLRENPNAGTPGLGLAVGEVMYYCNARETYAEAMQLASQALEIQSRTGRLPSYAEMLEQFTAQRGPNGPRRAQFMRPFQALYEQSLEHLRNNPTQGPTARPERVELRDSEGRVVQAEPLTQEQIRLIRERYRAATGSELDPAFLDQVVRHREIPITQAEQNRADDLARSFRESRALSLELEQSVRRLSAVERELTRLRQADRPATHLLRRLSQPGSESLCQNLFGVQAVNELPADHPVRTMLERYSRAAIGGLIPEAESPNWSERQATQALNTVLESRRSSLAEQADRAAIAYGSQRHAREAAVLGQDVAARASQEVPDLLAARSGDGQQREFLAAQRLVEARRHELHFLDLVQARLREAHPNRLLRDTPAREIEAAMRVVLSELDGASNGLENFERERLSAHELSERTAAGERLLREFARVLSHPNETPSRTTLARVMDHLSPSTTSRADAARDLDLFFDPLPSARELARLSAGRHVVERGPTGLVVRREGAAQEWSSERVPSREEIQRIVNQEIERLERDIRDREQAGREVRAEERALLEAYRRTREALANPNEHQTRELEANTRRAFGRSRAAVGSAIGISIIASAALGWYIRMNEGGRRPPALAGLQLPGC